MKEIKLTYSEIESLRHIVKSKLEIERNLNTINKLEQLSLKLIGMRAQLEYPKSALNWDVVILLVLNSIAFVGVCTIFMNELLGFLIFMPSITLLGLFFKQKSRQSL